MIWQLYIRKSISFMSERSTLGPHLIACWVYSKQRNCLKVDIQHCGKWCMKWDFATKNIRIGTTYMNNQGLSSNGMTIYTASRLILSSIFLSYSLSFFLRSFCLYCSGFLCVTIPGFSRPVTAIVEYTIVVQCHSGWMGGWPTMQYHLLMMVLAGTLTLFYNVSVLRVLFNLKKRHYPRVP